MTVATTALDSTYENGRGPEDDLAKQEAYEREYHALMDQYDEEKRHQERLSSEIRKYQDNC